MKIAVVTDSTSYLSTEEVERYHIHVVPIPVVIDGRSYNEGVDITLDEFWEKLRNSKSFPSTSQPPMGEMIQLYQQLGDEGYDTIISIHLASTISGFVNSLRDVNSQLTNTKVIVYDSQITVKLMGYLAIEAARMADKAPMQIKLLPGWMTFGPPLTKSSSWMISNTLFAVVGCQMRLRLLAAF